MRAANSQTTSTVSRRSKSPEATAQHPAEDDVLLRIDQVLAMVPIGRSTWWAGIRAGKFPEPVKLGYRTSAWRRSDIRRLIEQGT